VTEFKDCEALGSTYGPQNHQPSVIAQHFADVPEATETGFTLNGCTSTLFTIGLR
jgi:hypothetical protein